MKLGTKFVAIFKLILPLFCVSSVYAADGFESVRCGSDIAKALIGKKDSNEKVVVLEKRHADLGLKDLGADEITDHLNLIFWLICGEEYAVLEGESSIRDVLKVPEHSKKSPLFDGMCEMNGKGAKTIVVVAVLNAEGESGDKLPAKTAWKIDEKKGKFVSIPTEGIRCPRDGIVTEDRGR
jgi:hypothetical protein